MLGVLVDQYFDSLGVMKRIDPKTSYFEIFDLDAVAFSPEVLDAQYTQLAEIFDPQRYRTKLPEEIEGATANSEVLKAAYSAIREPAARAAYLLKQSTVSVPDSDGTNNEFYAVKDAIVRWNAGERSDDVRKTLVDSEQQINGQLAEENDRLLDLFKDYDHEEVDHSVSLAKLSVTLAKIHSLNSLQSDLNSIVA